MRNLAELYQLIGEFREIGVEPLVVKGLALAHQLYRDPGVRVSRDIDLLVDAGELERVERMLKAKGYSEFGGWISHEEYEKYHYHFVYTRGEHRDRVVEIHWNLLDPTWGHPVVTGAVREPAKEIDVGGLRVKTLDDTHALWHLSVHFFYGGSLGLQNLADMKALALRIPGSQWGEMIRFSHRHSTFNELSTALAIAEMGLGSFVPDGIRDELRSGAFIRTMLLPTWTRRGIVWNWVPFKPTHQLTVRFFLRRDLAGKVRYLYRLVVPSRESLIETRGAENPPSGPMAAAKFHLTGFWIFFKVLGAACLLSLLVKSKLLGARRLDPRYDVELPDLLGARTSDAAPFPAGSATE
jgi:hypothetical protein